jgi:hypothetical protein
MPVCHPFDDTDANYCFASETEIITREDVAWIGDLAGTRQMVLTQRNPESTFHARKAASDYWAEVASQSFGEQQLLRVMLKRYGQRKVIRAGWPRQVHPGGRHR